MFDTAALDRDWHHPPSTIERKPRAVVLAGAGIGPEITASALRVMEAAGADVDFTHHGVPDGASYSGRLAPPKATLEAIDEAEVVLRGPLDSCSGRVMGPAAAALRLNFGLHTHIRAVKALPGVGLGPTTRDLNAAFVYETLEGATQTGVAPGPAATDALRRRAERLASTALLAVSTRSAKKVVSALHERQADGDEAALAAALQAGSNSKSRLKISQMTTDACARRLVADPGQFDVVVSSSLDGAILSELASGLAGGRHLTASADLGARVAMFGPVHGAAPDLAGQDVANPTGMILSAAMMLRHIGQTDAAQRIERAVEMVYALQRGLPRDVAHDLAISGSAFTEAVIDALGNTNDARLMSANALAA